MASGQTTPIRLIMMSIVVPISVPLRPKLPANNVVYEMLINMNILDLLYFFSVSPHVKQNNNQRLSTTGKLLRIIFQRGR